MVPRSLRSRAVRAMLFAALATIFFASTVGDAEARKKGRKKTRRPPHAVATERLSHPDRDLVGAMQRRDRADLPGAFDVVKRLSAVDPHHVGAHRLYQEMAALSRRDGRLVEAEYRHWRDKDPDDPFRLLLHASAMLTSALTSPSALGGDWAETIERELAAAAADRDVLPMAELVEADLAKVRGDDAAVRSHNDAAWAAAPKDPLVRTERLRILAHDGAISEALPICLDLIEATPWRVLACAPLFDERPGITLPDEEQTAKVLTALATAEKKRASDGVTLQSILSFYETVQENSLAGRVRQALRALDPGWAPAVARSPYLSPLEGGELSADEIAALKRMEDVYRGAEDGAKGQLIALRSIEAELPESPRVQAVFWQFMAQALRDPEVGDREGGRGALKRAMELDPIDPHLRNAWAYTAASDSVELGEALAASEEAMRLLLGRGFEPRDLDDEATLGDWEAERAGTIGAFIDTRGWVLHRLGRHQEAVRDLQLAAILTDDGTVQGHLGRARFALGETEGAFMQLVRALALGTEEEEEVRSVAERIWTHSRVVPGGLDAVIEETKRQLGTEERSERRDRAPHPPPEVPTDDHPMLGQIAPDTPWIDLDGTHHRLSELRGRVVVVDFWASWCRPCRKSLPGLDAVSQAFADRPVSVLALSVDEDAAEVPKYWKGESHHMAVGHAGQSATEAWRFQAIPSTFLVDPEGRIVRWWKGYDSGQEEAIIREIVATMAAAKLRP